MGDALKKGSALDRILADLAHDGTLATALGLEIVEAGGGTAVVRLPWSKPASQTGGLLHGGAIATLSDTAGAVGALSLLPEGWHVVTGEMKINFLGNIRHGAALARAELLHQGGRTLVWEIRVFEESGSRLLAVATSTFFPVPPPP